MRIVCPFFEIQDVGGIATHLETLARGLKRRGHTVDIKVLRRGGRVPTATVWPKGSITSVFGGMFNFGNGWPATEQNLLRYGAQHLNKAKQTLESYDIVFWFAGPPTRSNTYEGDTDWRSLFDIQKPQFATVHDVDPQRQLPMYAMIADHLAGIISDHPRSYEMAKGLGKRMTLIPSAHELLPDCHQGRTYKERTPGYVCVQQWNYRKHVDDIIRAVPFMADFELAQHFGGDGIECRYMQSPTKCKDRYFWHVGDTDARAEWNDMRIWDVALADGMEYHGRMSEPDKESLLAALRLQIDPSKSTGEAVFGDHFNRTTIEAMKFGAIPMARVSNVSASNNGKGALLVPYVHYLPIPEYNAPKEIAQKIVWAALEMPEADVDAMQNMNHSLLRQYFDVEMAAEQHEAFFSGKDAGFDGQMAPWTQTHPIPELKCDERAYRLADEFWRRFFMGEQPGKSQTNLFEA